MNKERYTCLCRGGEFVSLLIEIAGSSANARSVGKNDPLEKVLCEPFAGFSAVGVQWQGLRQGLPSSCSRKFLWQVSMLMDSISSLLYNIQQRTNFTVDVCCFLVDDSYFFCVLSYEWMNQCDKMSCRFSVLPQTTVADFLSVCLSNDYRRFTGFVSHLKLI